MTKSPRASIMRVPVTLTVVLTAAVVATACRDKTPPPPGAELVGGSGPAAATLSAEDRQIRDSVRARAASRFATRPDTLYARADSARTLGAASAPVWVIFVGQLQCAACTDAIRDLLPVLRREYVESGRIHLAYVNAEAPDTNYNARFAAHAAYCGAIAGKFWPMLDSIAATREEWARMPDPQPRFDSLAVRLGAKADFQSRCTTRKLMLPLVMSDQERAAKAGVTTLPSLLIGSEVLSGNLSPSRVRSAIDQALKRR
jgi:protein-disulfide isomerase